MGVHRAEIEGGRQPTLSNASKPKGMRAKKRRIHDSVSNQQILKSVLFLIFLVVIL